MAVWLEKQNEMNGGHSARLEIQPAFTSMLPEIAGFLHRWHNREGPQSSKLGREPVASIERRLHWLLSDNPLATGNSPVGYCVRDDSGLIRGLDLFSPTAFLCGDRRLMGLCSGTFLVEPTARSLGFYLFKKCVNTPGYSFYFACSCNTHSSPLWRGIGACAVPNSDIEYLVPLRLDMAVAAYVAYKTSSGSAARFARVCSRGANPIVRFLTRGGSNKLAIARCDDWDKLAELSRRHRSAAQITRERSAALLEWRYGRRSPSYPCEIYSLGDRLGNEGWVCLGHLTRGGTLRSAILLDAVWPQDKMSYREVFDTILRVCAATTDAITFRWQPGSDYPSYSPCVISRKLPSPRAFVGVPKGAAPLPLELFDYDDSECIAWTFDWRHA